MARAAATLAQRRDLSSLRAGRWAGEEFLDHPQREPAGGQTARVGDRREWPAITNPHLHHIGVIDFGDSWHHVLIVEDPYAGPSEHGLRIRCLDSENAYPPEDVGGPGGYADFLAVIADPSHEEHAQFLAWVGVSFDPARFDITAVNLLLDSIKS